MTHGIEISEVSHNFGQKRVLDQITLSIKKGTFCALLGPNGAGKSTLFSALTRLLIPTHGTIKIHGNDIHKSPRPALSNIGVVFQQQTMDLDLTVFQNLRYFGKLQEMSGKDLNQRIDQVLTLLNMAERSHEVVRTLNGGHRRRAEIAAALFMTPKFCYWMKRRLDWIQKHENQLRTTCIKLPKQRVKRFCGQHIYATKLVMTTSWSFYTMAKSLEMVGPMKLRTVAIC